MKYLVSAFVLILSVTTVTSLFAHTNRLHKSRLVIRHEQADKAASIKLLQDNKFKDQIKSLQILEEKISVQRDPEERLKNINRYTIELQRSIDTMQRMVNQYGSESDNVVVTHNDDVLPLSYRFTMMQQLLKSMSLLQKYMIEQLKNQKGGLPSFKP